MQKTITKMSFCGNKLPHFWKRTRWKWLKFGSRSLTIRWRYLAPRENRRIKWLTAVFMEYKSTTFNSFEKGSKLFFPSLFTVCLSLLPFYVKFEQLNVNKWTKRATESPMRDWALVDSQNLPVWPHLKLLGIRNWVWFNIHAK